MPVNLSWENIIPEKHFTYSKIVQSSGHNGNQVKVTVCTDDTDVPHKFIHQTPKLRIPFGLQENDSPNGIRYNASFSFPGVCKDEKTGKYTGGTDPKVLQYLEWMQSVESFNRQVARTECKDWFKKDLSMEVIDTLYHSNLFPAKDETKYSPTFKTNIMAKKVGDTQQTQFTTKFYNLDQEEITFNDFHNGDEVVALLETSGLWFAGKQFGMSFRILQILVFERDTFKGCGINMEAYKDYMRVPRSITEGEGQDDEGPVAKKAKFNISIN